MPWRQPTTFKSTWRSKPRSQWSFPQKFIDAVNVHSFDLDKPVPVHAKTDKVPYLSQWSQHLFVIVFGFLPIAIHQLWLSLSGSKSPFSSWGILLLYETIYNFVAVHEVNMFRKMAHKYGFFDGDKSARDGIPDHAAGKLVLSIYKVTLARIGMAIYLTYDGQTSPMEAMSSRAWWAWAAVCVGVYPIVLDFWFYWYHRAMHDVSFLWKFHRTHHTTKHPNALMTVYADHEQELIDIVGIPLMTYLTMKYMGFPIDFYTWWVCQQYVIYTEIWGHCGVRVHFTPPSTLHWLLTALHSEISIEDHDLHHRKGWRKSHNYGKQTRLWDQIFGTCIPRIESKDDNIDWKNPAHMPLF